ncbi:survival motor neuron interacting protein 1-domain-containing protein, partial [Sporodiniella umbellata]
MSKRIFSQIADDGSDRSAIPISKKKAELVDGIPVSGEDYLLTVREQAKKCVQVAIAAPPKEIKKVQLPFHFQFDQFTTDEKDQPRTAWREGFEAPFRSYRTYAQAKQQGLDKKEIKTLEQGKQLLYSLESKEACIDAVVNLSQHSIINLLRYHITWLNVHEIEQQCLCLFSLLVYLDPVLTSKDISVLRDVSRKCIELRNNVEKKAPLNIVITIISQVFGQN